MQNKKLVSILNELHQAGWRAWVSSVSAKPFPNLSAARTVVRRNRVHGAHQCPEYAQHKSEHDQLTDGCRLQGKFHSNEIGLTVEVMGFLKDWLCNHILRSDKSYGPFLNAHGVH